MKRFFISFLVVILAAGVNAQENTELNVNPNAPKLIFESQVIDYGEVEKGGDGVRYFKFVNEGKEPLIISNVKSSCGCTVPEYPRSPIGPGEESEIKVKYNTNRVGPFRKTITIFSNTSDGKIVLTVKGKVINKV